MDNFHDLSSRPERRASQGLMGLSLDLSDVASTSTSRHLFRQYYPRFELKCDHLQQFHLVTPNESHSKSGQLEGL